LKVNKNFAYGKLLKVLTSSADRIKPPCVYYSKCGGCHLMHMNYGAQKRFKQSAVENCLGKAGVSVPLAETAGSEKILSYRNKLQLPVAEEGGAVKIGFYRENSHNIADIDICPVVGGDSRLLVEAIRKYIEDSGDTAYNETAGSGNIRHVVLRAAAGAVLVTIVVADGKLKDEKKLIGLLKERFLDFGLYININRQRNNVILGETYKHIYGRRFLETETLGIRYKITPGAFAQINAPIAGQIYEETARFIQNNAAEAVIDAYSGIGVLSAYVAGFTKRVYAVELDAETHTAAEALKEENSVKNLVNILGDVKDELLKIHANLPPEIKTAVILDPPRKGCSPAVLDALLAVRPALIAYISCNPATLARDIKHLSPLYEITAAAPYDMFPQTKHVETLICLQRKTK
jgi:23S rRNA (uracil1939-C5)-methyltransferase